MSREPAVDRGRIRGYLLRRLADDERQSFEESYFADDALLDRVEADWPLRLNLPVGSTVPPHCSASGKLLLASLPAAEREALVAEMPLTRFTQRTITDRSLLARELDRIADAGYAVDDEEYVLGVACV
ncbi:MAG TPA: IclR family transcriptional regulator C-terminal domain-containing protein, partial [Thermoanaerobaculia bacterium]|nr:IclR family transcriptional regulator C-terminal domain-containing protein [Thermoanaerobaculia bacterium]